MLTKPAKIENIEIRNIEPEDPADTDVQVLVKAFSLNFGDLLCINGLYPTMPEYPFTPGFEISGVVLKTGDMAGQFQVGDEVMGLTGINMGGHSAIVNTNENLLVKKPSNITHEEACAFPVVFLTMHHVFEIAKVKSGEKILIQTAAGGTGLIAVQMAKIIGADIYATASSNDKLDYLKKMGVNYLINYQKEDFSKKILEYTNGYGVDVVINTLPGDAIQKGIDILAPCGRYIEIAMTALKSSNNFDLSNMVDNQVICSVDLRRLITREPDRLREYFDIMVRHLEEGTIRPTVLKVFPFREIKEAYKFMQDRKNIGKIVVTMPEINTPYVKKENLSQDVAVIGMSCRFPGAANIDEFWENLILGKSHISSPPKGRWGESLFYGDDNYYKWGGFLEDIDKFDPLFFNMSGREAEQMDPQQRLFLEESFSALEDAGYANKSISNKNVSVFVGAVRGDYPAKIDAQSFLGNSNSILAARISYFLNLKGPSIPIDTACSSSLVAIHLACQSLISRESEMAIAGGVFVYNTPAFHIMTTSAGMLSPEGRCKTFDDSADGFVPGEGVGVVVLKPLLNAIRDGDNIYGVIKGSGINQDGKTNGITAPSAKSQTDLEISVYEKFNVNPETITYIEAHGTGTKLGDPIEIEALTNAFRKYTNKKQYCAIGSVKTNIGHTASAAGIAGFIKALLSLKNKQIPPSLNFKKENQYINFKESPFYVIRTFNEWKIPEDIPRRAGISSFGFSGTNAHVIVEEYKDINLPNSKNSQPILISAKNKDRLKVYVKNIYEFILKHKKNLKLSQISATLQYRDLMDEKIAVSAKDMDDLIDKLDRYVRDEKSLLVESDLKIIHKGQKTRRIHLPTYPFEKKSYWFDSTTKKKETDDNICNFFYKPTWFPYDFKPHPELKVKNRVLIIYPKDCLKLKTVISENYSNDEVFELVLNEEDIDVFINKIGHIDIIYFLGGIKEKEIDIYDLDELKESQEKGILSLFRLVKAIEAFNPKLIVITNDVHKVTEEDVGFSFSGSLQGLTRVIAKEYRKLSAKYIDITLKDIKVIAPIIKKLSYDNIEEAAIRYGKPYIRILETINIPRSNYPAFKKQGVYFILGGAGGIGVEFSKYLSKNFQAKLVLIGRKKINESLKEKILEIEKLGGEVLYISSDGSDFESMNTAFQTAKKAFGKINGVIHSAIVLKDKAIYNMDEDTLKDVLSPKVNGSVVLAKIFKDEPLDFMIFFSSAQSFTANMGQANYAAACTFKDSFALHLQNVAPYPVKIINWGYFGDVGIVSDNNHKNRLLSQGVQSISLQEGIDAISKILTGRVRQIMAFKASDDILSKMGINNSYQIETYPENRPSVFQEALSKIEFPVINLDNNPSNSFYEMNLFGKSLLFEVFSKISKEDIIPSYNKLYRALEDILADFKYSEYENLDEKKDKLINDFPEISAYVKLLWTCLKNYPQILTGKIPATDIMFPNSSMELVENVYKGNITADFFNNLVLAGVISYIKTRESGDEKIYILEVGAGTGGTSATLLSAISKHGENIHYVYTDISKSFILYGEKNYGKYSFVEFNTFDIETDPLSQGYENGAFDIIIASNVIHATKSIKNAVRNLKTLLKANGWMVINEITSVMEFSTLTFGLLDGWWLFEDEEYRIKGSPLLSTEMWKRVLYEEGFDHVIDLINNYASPQNVIIAESNGEIRKLKENKRSIEKKLNQDIAEKIIDILVSVLKVDRENITTDTSYTEFGVDSILAVEIINEINEKLNLNLRTTDLFNYPTILKLKDHITNNFSGEIKHNDEDRIILNIIDRLKVGELDIYEADQLIEEEMV
ncbi:MAG: SDR family NAD(P)-dependent oxidoreductase [Desulfobacterales bacterium]|nr:SDR family NAD(P)-dependent oxidoreductase [Desulfobacterales bacterium]